MGFIEANNLPQKYETNSNPKCGLAYKKICFFLVQDRKILFWILFEFLLVTKAYIGKKTFKKQFHTKKTCFKTFVLKHQQWLTQSIQIPAIGTSFSDPLAWKESGCFRNRHHSAQMWNWGNGIAKMWNCLGIVPLGGCNHLPPFCLVWHSNGAFLNPSGDKMLVRTGPRATF